LCRLLSAPVPDQDRGGASPVDDGDTFLRMPEKPNSRSRRCGHGAPSV